MGSAGDLWKPLPKTGDGVIAPAAGNAPNADTTCIVFHPSKSLYTLFSLPFHSRSYMLMCCAVVKEMVRQAYHGDDCAQSESRITCPMGVAGCNGAGAEKGLAGAWGGGPPRDGGRLALLSACSKYFLSS